jgi:hypothetical protein
MTPDIGPIRPPGNTRNLEAGSCHTAVQARAGPTPAEQASRPPTDNVHISGMTDTQQEPVMLPFPNKEGPGWYVIIRYHAGHERRIEGFATEQEALDWIVANAGEVDK